MFRSEEVPPLHPGTILAEDFMVPMRLSGRALACALHVSHTRIAAIMRGTTAITADTAMRLGCYFNTSPWFWMNLQVRFDLEMAERAKPHPTANIRPAPDEQAEAWHTVSETGEWHPW